MNKQELVRLALAVTLFSLVSISGWASGQGGPGGGRKGPPPEAIEACEGKAVGDSVEFTGPRGDTVEATCKEMDGQLAAVPNNAPEGGGRR